MKEKGMRANMDFGERGEFWAVGYLRSQNYEILAENWRTGHSEVDIIAKEGDFLVFIEVKTRSSKHFGNPESAVSSAKQKALIRAAEVWILENKWKGPLRFDVVSILKQGNRKDFLLIKDAFYPGLDANPLC